MNLQGEELRRWRISKIERLPWLAFRHRRYLPAIPAIYFVLDDVPELLYVGQATNLHDRWRAHHRASQMQELYRICWYEVRDARDRDRIEGLFIYRMFPLWNGETRNRSIV
jgi:hypothetical protein